MGPPIYSVCADDSVVQNLLASAEGLRIYPFGHAKQKTEYPYVVWQTIYGSPENYLANTPTLDTYGTQVDCYGKTWREVREVATAIRDALEPAAYITAWNGESVDPVTKSYRVSFNVDWITART